MEGKNQQGVIQLVQVDEDGGSELISDVFLGGSFVQAVEIIPPGNKNGQMSNSAKDPSPHGENTPSNEAINPNISKDNQQQPEEEESSSEQDQSKYLFSEVFSIV